MKGINGRILFPSKKLCTDNGSMVAFTGWLYYKNGKSDKLDIDAYSNKKTTWSALSKG